MAKISKIEQARQAFQVAKARADEARERHNVLGEEFKQLKTELYNKRLSPLKCVEIEARIKIVVSSEEPSCFNELEQALLELNRVEQEFNLLNKKLQGARYILDTIANPPAWGLNQHISEIRQIESRAKQTISELT